jgi:hypothetical protein
MAQLNLGSMLGAVGNLFFIAPNDTQIYLGFLFNIY